MLNRLVFLKRLCWIWSHFWNQVRHNIKIYMNIFFCILLIIFERAIKHCNKISRGLNHYIFRRLNHVFRTKINLLLDLRSRCHRSRQLFLMRLRGRVRLLFLQFKFLSQIKIGHLDLTMISYYMSAPSTIH